jgi:TrmH family RNA methyltransferase
MSVPVRFVLLEPRNPENIGAAARALKNFGFNDWVLVNPQTSDDESSRRLAVQSQDVLAQARKAATLDAAIADCIWVVGTTSRIRRGHRRLSAREAALSLAEKSAEGRVALVFGEERSGMTNEQLDRCHATSAVFTSEGQPSINLAQAILLYAYEVRLALERNVSRAHARPVAATDAQVQEVKEALIEALTRGAFLRDGRRGALREMSTVLDRAGLTRKEAALWTKAFRSIAKRLG